MEGGSTHGSFLCEPGPLPWGWQGHGLCSHLQFTGLTFISTDFHPSRPHNSLSPVGKGLLSHFYSQGNKPKRLSDLLKNIQLVGDSQD